MSEISPLKIYIIRYKHYNMRLLYLILLINLIISCKPKKKVLYIKDDFTTQSTLERNMVTFYKNNKRFDSVKVINPQGNIYDGNGYIKTQTPTYEIELFVEFNVYGHIRLEMVDSCFKEFILNLANGKRAIFPKKIVILKHHKIIQMFNNHSALAGMTLNGTAFYLSEVYASNNIALKFALTDLFLAYMANKQMQESGDNIKKLLKTTETI